jgi:TolB-like protein
LHYRFEGFSLDTERRELRRDGNLRSIEPKVFDLLVHLIANRGRVVSKDDLVAAIWGGRAVSESALTTSVNAVRRAVGDDGKAQRWVKTLPRKGLRFVGDVREELDLTQVEAIDGGMGNISPEADKASVAVLPFKKLVGDGELGSFISGIVGDLTADLSLFPSLRVVSRSVTAKYHEEHFDVRQIARELGVQYTIEGSVEGAGERLRVTVQLTEANCGTQLWAQRFDINRVDLPAVRDEIRMIIVGSLTGEGGPLTKAEHQRAMRKSPDTLTARDLYYRAEAEFWKFDKDASARARALLERSLALDPHSVGAHALLAWVHWCDVQAFEPECREASLDIAHKEARTSVALDPTDYRGHWVLGAVLRVRGEPDAASAEYERALDLNQSDPDLLAECAEFLSFSGRADQAVAQLKRAITFNRFHPEWYLRVLDRAYYNARQYEEAIRLGRRFQNPRVTVLENLAASYAQLGRTREARETIDRMLAIKSGHSIEAFVAGNPEVDRSVLQHFVEGLRKAGLPEKQDRPSGRH